MTVWGTGAPGPLVALAAVLVLVAGRATADLATLNETPNNTDVVCFEPIIFTAGDQSEALRNAVTKEGYTVTRYKNETNDNNPESGTLTKFVLCPGKGILFVSSHGSNTALAVQCYDKTEAGKTARDNAFGPEVNNEADSVVV